MILLHSLISELLCALILKSLNHAESVLMLPMLCLFMHLHLTLSFFSKFGLLDRIYSHCINLLCISVRQYFHILFGLDLTLLCLADGGGAKIL